MANIVLTLLYFLIVSLIALISKLFRADFLKIRLKGDSYWLDPDLDKNKHDLEILKKPF